MPPTRSTMRLFIGQPVTAITSGSWNLQICQERPARGSGNLLGYNRIRWLSSIAGTNGDAFKEGLWSTTWCVNRTAPDCEPLVKIPSKNSLSTQIQLPKKPIRDRAESWPETQATEQREWTKNCQRTDHNGCCISEIGNNEQKELRELREKLHAGKMYMPGE